MQVCCLLLDAMFSTCSYDIKLDPVTGKYLGSFKVTATKDFVSDGSQTHEVSFNPIVSFNHPVWSNYNVHPIHVSNYWLLVCYLWRRTFRLKVYVAYF